MAELLDRFPLPRMGLHLCDNCPHRPVMAARCLNWQAPTDANEIWAMDFVSDALFDGKRFNALTVIDA